eukprot:1922850-Amphidinium_carterae.1
MSLPQQFWRLFQNHVSLPAVLWSFDAVLVLKNGNAPVQKQYSFGILFWYSSLKGGKPKEYQQITNGKAKEN